MKYYVDSLCNFFSEQDIVDDFYNGKEFKGKLAQNNFNEKIKKNGSDQTSARNSSKKIGKELFLIYIFDMF